MLREINVKYGVVLSLSNVVNTVQSNIKPVICSTVKYTKENDKEKKQDKKLTYPTVM